MTARRFIFVSATMLAILALVCGCSPKPGTQPEEPQAPTVAPEEPIEVSQEPVILRVGGLTDADCWNPFGCTAPYMWGGLIYEGFADSGSSSEGCPSIPRMAESWELSDDGLAMTLHLREGMSYSDGTPITAETVKESLEWRAATPGVAEWFSISMNLESVEVIDDLTLQYTTFDPLLSAPNSADFGGMFVLPPYIWSEVSEDELFLFENYPPVGNGPYVLTEHVPGSHMIFDAREDYYQGKPPIDRIVYTVYANPDAMINALVTGEIDLTRQDLSPENVDALMAESNITVEETAPNGTFELAFNMSAEFPGHPAVQDPAVREAIDYAIDKQQIVDVVFQGHASVCPTGWACGPYYEEKVPDDLAVTPFDLEKAGRILDDAGYVDADGDGVRETPDGQPLEFRLTYTTDFPTSLTMVEMISDWLAEIGIEVEIIANDWATWYAAVREARDFDMTIDQRVSENDPTAMDFWMSCWAAEPGGFNTSGYCNEEMDFLVYDFMLSPDAEGRWESAYEAQRILNSERPFIVLVGKHDIQAFRNDRFEFALDTCGGMFTPQGVLNVKFP